MCWQWLTTVNAQLVYKKGMQACKRPPRRPSERAARERSKRAKARRASGRPKASRVGGKRHHKAARAASARNARRPSARAARASAGSERGPSETSGRAKAKRASRAGGQSHRKAARSASARKLKHAAAKVTKPVPCPHPHRGGHRDKGGQAPTRGSSVRGRPSRVGVQVVVPPRVVAEGGWALSPRAAKRSTSCFSAFSARRRKRAFSS